MGKIIDIKALIVNNDLIPLFENRRVAIGKNKNPITNSASKSNTEALSLISFGGRPEKIAKSLRKSVSKGIIRMNRDNVSVIVNTHTLNCDASCSSSSSGGLMFFEIRLPPTELNCSD